MSARDDLFRDIWDMRSTAEKNALIDAFAHELAERIRAAVAADDDYELRAEEYGANTNVLHAADLIDPQTQTHA